MIDNNLVLFKKSNDEKNNLFFIHHVSGEVDVYNDFCSRLKIDFNLWSIKADRFKDICPENLSIIEIAKNYVSKIKKVQEVGPYYISGWSLGGIIAFEIVRQLEKKGDQVEFLALIDSPPPDKNLKRYAGNFSLNGELNWIMQFVQPREIIEKLKTVNNIKEFWETEVNYLLESNFNKEMLREVLPPLLMRLISNYETLEIRDIVYYINVIRSLSNASNLYVPPGKINAQMYYFEASRTKNPRKISWCFYCKKPIKCYRIIGDHFSIFTQPHVVEFSEIFEKVINNRSSEIDNDRFSILKSSAALRLLEIIGSIRRKITMRALERKQEKQRREAKWKT